MEIVSNTRGIGSVGAFDINKKVSAQKRIRDTKRIGYKVFQKGLKKNLVLRPLGDTIYLFLPLCTTRTELNDIFERTYSVLEEIM